MPYLAPRRRRGQSDVRHAPVGAVLQRLQRDDETVNDFSNQHWWWCGWCGWWWWWWWWYCAHPYRAQQFSWTRKRVPNGRVPNGYERWCCCCCCCWWWWCYQIFKVLKLFRCSSGGPYDSARKGRGRIIEAYGSTDGSTPQRGCVGRHMANWNEMRVSGSTTATRCCSWFRRRRRKFSYIFLLDHIANPSIPSRILKWFINIV